MLGGSAGFRQAPSLKIWYEICKALNTSIPNLKIYFTGVSSSTDDRTTTAGFTLEAVDFLISHLPNAARVYDVGLWNQIAFIESCDIFLSPHTGFAFIAPLVGTKWLEIGTCPWPTYLFNDLAFYTVLPKCGSYPSKFDRDSGCGKLLSQGKRAICVTDKYLRPNIPDIAKGVKLLLDDKFSYEHALKLHLEKINKNYTLNDFAFFGIDKADLSL